jgi:hypothetical protein
LSVCLSKKANLFHLEDAIVNKDTIVLD